MSRLQEWFQEHPRARPLLTFSLVGFFCLGAGIWLTARRPQPIAPINRTPEVVSSGVPTMSGESPRPIRAPIAWTVEDTPLRPEPGLNVEPLRQLGRWEEVAHLQEHEQWDEIRLADGSQGWVQSKSLTFTKPANLSKPSEAEAATMAFYQAVMRKDYVQAYHYLAGPWREELDFNRFVEGYSRTVSLRTEIRQVIPMGQGTYQVDVSMIADEMGQDVPYLGSYLVEKVGEDWLLTSGSLARSGPPASERPPSTTLRVPVVETLSPTPEALPSAEPTADPVEELPEVPGSDPTP